MAANSKMSSSETEAETLSFSPSVLPAPNDSYAFRKISALPGPDEINNPSDSANLPLMAPSQLDKTISSVLQAHFFRLRGVLHDAIRSDLNYASTLGTYLKPCRIAPSSNPFGSLGKSSSCNCNHPDAGDRARTDENDPCRMQK